MQIIPRGLGFGVGPRVCKNIVYVGQSAVFGLAPTRD